MATAATIAAGSKIPPSSDIDNICAVAVAINISNELSKRSISNSTAAQLDLVQNNNNIKLVSCYVILCYIMLRYVTL
jgi:hypothetical protein